MHGLTFKSSVGDWRRVIIEAMVVVILSAVAAIAVNIVRGEHLPWIADEPYEIFVPCPEPLGEVSALVPSALEINDDKTVIIDARTADLFGTWHIDRAINVSFDYLDPVPEQTINDVVSQTARSGAQRVVVYGDGGNPDSGRELARELAGRGLKNVFFITGGADAIRSKPVEGCLL